MEDGHADGNAHFDLFLNDRAVDVVGEQPVDFNASVHRARVHDDGVVFGVFEFVAIETEAVVIFALGGDEAAVHPLFLQAQHHDDIGVFEAFLHVLEHFRAKLINACRHECARPDQADAVLHAAQEQHV